MWRRDRWWVRELERQSRAHAAERAELLTVIARLAGKPAAAPNQPDEPEPMQPIEDQHRFTASPEQFLD